LNCLPTFKPKQKTNNSSKVYFQAKKPHNKYIRYRLFINWGFGTVIALQGRQKAKARLRTGYKALAEA
jgi:hypothetical protein